LNSASVKAAVAACRRRFASTVGVRQVDHVLQKRAAFGGHRSSGQSRQFDSVRATLYLPSLRRFADSLAGA
jgi:hypothetical protein